MNAFSAFQAHPWQPDRTRQGRGRQGAAEPLQAARAVDGAHNRTSRNKGVLASACDNRVPLDFEGNAFMCPALRVEPLYCWAHDSCVTE
jgi:hypothetical protein